MKISLSVASLLTIVCFAFWIRWDVSHGTTFSRTMQDLRQFQDFGIPTERAIDPWGHYYLKVSATVDERTVYSMFSCGPDGKSATFGLDPDDITAWTRSDVWMESLFPYRICTYLMTFFAGIVVTLAVLLALRSRATISPNQPAHPTAGNAPV